MTPETTEEVIELLTDQLETTTAQALKELAEALEGLEYNDIAACREIIIYHMQRLGIEYTEYAAMFAAEAYDKTRELQTTEAEGFKAEKFTGWDEATAAAISASVVYLLQGIVNAQSMQKAVLETSLATNVVEALAKKPDSKEANELISYAVKVQDAERVEAAKTVEAAKAEFNKELADKLDYRIKYAAGETTLQNGMKDPKRPKFARVPAGNDACDFCLMLASRGFVYLTRESAGEFRHYHPNCRCRIVPGFQGKTTIEGYDPDAIYHDLKTREREKLKRKEEREQAAKLKREEEKRKANERAKTEGYKQPYHLRARYEDEALDRMTRKELEARGRAAAINKAYSLDIGVSEAMRRYNTLAPYSTDEELKKYLKAWGTKYDKPRAK